MVKNPPANTEGMDLIPGPGIRIPHAIRQLSPWAIISEPTRSRVHALQQEKPPQREAVTPQPESSPWSPQLEKAHALQLRASAAPSPQMYNQINKILLKRESPFEVTCWWGETMVLSARVHVCEGLLANLVRTDLEVGGKAVMKV